MAVVVVNANLNDNVVCEVSRKVERDWDVGRLKVMGVGFAGNGPVPELAVIQVVGGVMDTVCWPTGATLEIQERHSSEQDGGSL